MSHPISAIAPMVRVTYPPDFVSCMEIAHEIAGITGQDENVIYLRAKMKAETSTASIYSFLQVRLREVQAMEVNP